MPALSRSLQETLHRAIVLANDRRHEYATLEHLLLSLLDDEDVQDVLKHTKCDLDVLRRVATDYVENELTSIVTEASEEAKPTAGFQRVVQRAVIHVQSTNREEVTGSHVLTALFSERESHAANFLHEQDVTRYDVVNYISHGIASRSRDPSRPFAWQEPTAQPRTGKTYVVEVARVGEVDAMLARIDELEKKLEAATARIAALEARLGSDGQAEAGAKP